MEARCTYCYPRSDMREKFRCCTIFISRQKQMKRKRKSGGQDTHVSLEQLWYSSCFLMYSITESSSKYFTDSPRPISRRASVDETSFATQFVTIVMLRRYLLSRSESKMNCSGLLPLLVMTTRPCCPKIASSCNEITTLQAASSSFASHLRHLHPKALVLRKIPISQRRTAV